MRILIVKLSSIGDVVHTLPAAALLRRALPGASITWVAERRASAILKDSPAIDELIEIDTRAWRKDFLTGSTISDMRAQLNQLRKSPNLNGAGNADIAIDFQGLIKSGLVAIASRANRRIGFETSDLREKASKLLLTEQVETAEFNHVIEKNLALARAAITHSATKPAAEAWERRHPCLPLSASGEYLSAQRRAGTDACAPRENVSSNGYEFPIAISPDDERWVEAAIENQSDPFAIINPGGGWHTKLWPPERFAELADWLSSECGLTSFVTFGPGEEALARGVASNARSGAARPLASTLKQFVALARRAALFVGGDTGPLHLAAASGAPIVGLYGPTSSERNGPFDPRDVTVGRDLWCRAECHRRSCWHWECMDIPMNDVKRAVLKRLANTEEERAD
jgi:lipopolysaccharide heptosyltransferase I